MVEPPTSVSDDVSVDVGFVVMSVDAPLVEGGAVEPAAMRQRHGVQFRSHRVFFCVTWSLPNGHTVAHSQNLFNFMIRSRRDLEEDDAIPFW